MVMGGGTNLIVSDLGFRGIMLRFVARRMLAAGDRVQCDAGAVLQDLVDFSIERGLQGWRRWPEFPARWARRYTATPARMAIPSPSACARCASSMASACACSITAECEFHYRESVFKRHKDWIVFRPSCA
jgi:UDP-N-acetylmuramate dehydrogenase